MYPRGEKMFPLGRGLSCAAFQSSVLKLSADNMKAGGQGSINFDVKNTGGRGMR